MKNRIHFLFVVLLSIVVGLVLIGSFLGAWHPLGDSLAVIRIPVAVFGLVLFLRPKVWRKLLWVPCLSVFVLGLHALDRVADTGGPGPYTLYQKNMLFSNTQQIALAQNIKDSSADFVTLQEVVSDNQDILEILRAAYPFQHVCNLNGWSGIAVLSKHPILDARCSEWRAFAAALVNTPDGPVWVVGLHLFWPFPKWQSPQLDRVLPKLSALKGPVILGGDFNMQPGTRVERVVRNATRSTALRPVFTTLNVGRTGIPVSIDQILAPCGKVERRPKLGSDHHGLLGHVGFNEATCRE